jgi:hypothetical protein
LGRGVYRSNHVWHHCQWFNIAGIENKAGIAFSEHFFLLLSIKEHISTDNFDSLENFSRSFEISLSPSLHYE